MGIFASQDKWKRQIGRRRKRPQRPMIRTDIRFLRFRLWTQTARNLRLRAQICREFNGGRTGWLGTQSRANPSPRSNSLLTGKRTGNFANSRPIEGKGAANSAASTGLYEQIPYAIEQGIFSAEQGNFLRDQGILLRGAGTLRYGSRGPSSDTKVGAFLAAELLAPAG